jgi:hypothetical protein
MVVMHDAHHAREAIEVLQQEMSAAFREKVH